MKKTVTHSVVALLAIATLANATTETDMQAQLDALTKKIEKLEKKQKKQNKKISEVKKLAAKDNIKFDVDFRTAYDNLNYKTATGEKYSNDALYSSRLWLGMGYAPTKTMLFKGQLAFQKAFGAQYNTSATQTPYNAFDWVINENLTDDTLRVKEAYWLWMPTAYGEHFTVSIGRRPATNGYLINLRDDDKAKSPIGHIINMEFDGFSGSWQLDKYVSGMYVKLCVGRGLTAATSRFDQTGLDYVQDTSAGSLDNMDLIGLIFKPYDDGQYSIMTKYYRTFNAVGNDMSGATPVLKSYGDVDGMAISAKMDGIGDEISDFLDDTTLFASFAASQTRPDSNEAMLGSLDKETGTSFWLGVQTPNLTGGKFGVEYNHGSKYWRPFTYGEDTMVGSKMAVRGSAYEAYWTQPIVDKVFSMQIRYTYLDYDYTGSNAFFGDAGRPLSMSEAIAAGQDPVETAQDIRVYFRYRY